MRTHVRYVSFNYVMSKCVLILYAYKFVYAYTYISFRKPIVSIVVVYRVRGADMSLLKYLVK